ncbi:MAG: hypothetical protein WBB76_12900, partial [Gaiellaceae bacterium]
DQTQTQNVGGSDSCKAGCGGGGGFQAGIQNAKTQQTAVGIAKSDQNAVNANVPVSIAGHDVNSGPSSATQTASSTANTDVKNKSKTDQDQNLTQNVGSGCGCGGKDSRDGTGGRDGKNGCVAGCGGAGGFQLGVQKADTNQWALGVAASNQNAVNSNAPVSIAGHDVNSGPSSATQTATSSADAEVKNKAKTDQDQTLTQDVGGLSSCQAGCGGPGGFQLGLQNAETNQWALGVAKSDQNAVNGNAPVSNAGGDVNSGPSSATQTATSSAEAEVKNKSKTDQEQNLTQNVGTDCGCGITPVRDGTNCGCGSRDGRDGTHGCLAGCGGAGAFQLGIQNAETEQWALGFAKSDQNAVNTNAPHAVAGGDISGRGSSTASQTPTSSADDTTRNRAKTDQDQWEEQLV